MSHSQQREGGEEGRQAAADEPPQQQQQTVEDFLDDLNAEFESSQTYEDYVQARKHMYRLLAQLRTLETNAKELLQQISRKCEQTCKGHVWIVHSNVYDRISVCVHCGKEV